MQFCSPSLQAATTQMETESGLTKQRRYDLSMSKRTRRTNIAMIVAEVKTGDESLLVFAPIASEEKKEAEQALNCTSDNSKVALKETVFAPATPRPSLKELIQVTNREERTATEQNLPRDQVREKDSEKEKENLSTGAGQQRQIVKGVKAPGPGAGVVRRCAKALNQMIKVRRYAAAQQKNVVPLIAM
jgi:hypothetical protein